jgi:exodeoxyribonuclease V gamma subunit
VREQLTPRLALPVGRGDPRMPTGVGHPLVTTWGRSSRESHALLLDAASHVPAVIEAPELVMPASGSASLLARLQQDIRSDQSPVAPEDRPVLQADDPSLRWHRAHGPARQVEILRDHLLHLFTETDASGAPRFMPRDVAVLCSDIATFAPLIEATFAGDPDGGVPRIPVRVADRTVRQQSALLDTAGALLDILDGRFRASQVLDLASRPPVQRRFGLGAAAVSRIEDWADATNVRWGLDGTDHAAFGLPADLSAHTWQSGFDQLLIGSTMTVAGPRLSAFDVAPFPDLEGSDVEIAGAFADLLYQLRRVTAALRTDATVRDWSDCLLEGLHALCDTTADDSWQWRDVEFAINGFRDEAKVGDTWRTTVVPAGELIELMRIRLDSSGGRARFGTGSVTVSSLTAQRGVPHQVVCLLGIDDDLGSGSMAAAEDLIATAPCIGDRDARSEHRAQLLDAVLCAGERLVLLSTGRDVRTNQALSPAVAVAELLDAIDLTVQSPDDRRPSAVLTVDHPRQAWSDIAFIPDKLGTASAWSFDRGALDAAMARRSNEKRPPFLDGPLPAPADVSTETPLVSLDQLRSAVVNPARVLLQDRLGMTIRDAAEPGDDQIPLELGGLQEWAIADELLRSRLGHALDANPAAIAQADQQWEAHERARGSVPPGRFGDDAIDDVRKRVDSLVLVLQTELGDQPYEPATVAVRLDLTASLGVVVEGNVQGVCGDTVVALSPSGLKPASILTAIIDLCALTLHDSSRAWNAVVIGRLTSGDPTAGAYRITLLDPTQAAEVLEVFLDLRARALCDAIPAFAATTKHVYAGDMKLAHGAWTPNERSKYKGDRGDRWVSAVPELNVDFDVLVELPSRPDELGADGSFVTRLDYWADRLWGTVERFAEVIEPGGPAAAPAGAANDAGDVTGGEGDD